MELNYKEFAGVILLVIALSTGTTYVKEATGYKSCSTGWALQNNGQFTCESRDIEPQWCYRFSKPNSQGIASRCYLGIPINKQENNPDMTEGDYTKSPDGVTCFIKGNLRRGVPCSSL